MSQAAGTVLTRCRRSRTRSGWSPSSSPRATSPRPSPRSAPASPTASATRRCSASPARARAPPSPGRSSRCRSPRWSSRPTSRWPPSSPTSSASSSPTTGSSTSSATTTTTSPRPTSPRATPTSRRTRRSTTRSTACATRPRRRCSPGATSSSSPRCRASTAWARPSEYKENVLYLLVGRPDRPAGVPAPLVDMQYDRNDIYLERGASSGCGATPSRCTPPTSETTLRIELFGDEIERITVVDPITGEQIRALDDLVDLPGHPLRGGRRAHAGGHRPHRGRAGRAARSTSRRRASCSRPSGCACARSTTSR